MNNTDKKNEEGGKPTQSNGAVHAAGVIGELSEERRYAEKFLWSFSLGPQSGNASCVIALIEKKPKTRRGSGRRAQFPGVHTRCRERSFSPRDWHGMW